MKKYTYSTTYSGQQITKIVCAKSIKEAAEKLEISTYAVNTYCVVVKIEPTDDPLVIQTKYSGKIGLALPFGGVVAYFDSGMLWKKEKSLIRVPMLLDQLTELIDKYNDLEYNKFKKELGIKN